MVIIKKSIHKTLFYLSSLIGLVLALITGIFLGTSQHNLSQLKNKAESIFGSSTSNIISSAKADVPGDGDGDGGGCGGDGSGGGGGSSGSSCGGCSGDGGY